MLKRLFADLLGGRRRAGAAESGGESRQADPFERAGELVRARDLDAAATLLAQARDEQPGDERGFFLHAEVLRLRGRHDEAMPVFRRALLANPKRADSWVGLGDCSVRAGDDLQACVYYRTALSLEPARADVLNELGLIALARANYTEATEHFDQAVSIDPLHAEAWNNFGLVAAAHGRLEQARRCFHRAAHLRRGFYTALCNLGLACRDLGRLDEAAQTLERAAEAEPDRAAAWVNLATVHQDQGLMEEARAALMRAVAAAPDDASVKLAHATFLARVGDVEAADRELAAVLGVSPRDAEANLAQAHLDLARGRYAEGWDRYEARLHAAQSPRRRFPLPEWDGAEPAGRTIMVYAEQGLGDTIMFASCVPELMRRAAGVAMHCEDRLWPLMQRSFPGLVRYDATVRERVDAYAAIGSLPRLYRRSEADFPRHEGYLRAAPDAQERAAGALGALGSGLKVGIAWRGGLPSTGKVTRSLSLDDLAPLLRAHGVDWISLQHGDTEAEIADFHDRSGIRLHRLEGVERDLDAAAAAICALDLVVTVCSSIVHLAGALGKATWVLAPHVPAWRYRLEGEAMPWYPAATLLRQPSPGAWQPVIDLALQKLTDVRR